MDESTNNVLFEDTYPTENIKKIVDILPLGVLAIISVIVLMIKDGYWTAGYTWLIAIILIAFVAASIFFIVMLKKYRLTVTEEEITVCYGKRTKTYKIDCFVGYNCSKQKKSEMRTFNLYSNAVIKGGCLSIFTKHYDEMIDLLIKHGKQKNVRTRSKKIVVFSTPS